jgi:hypothetical protein
VVIAGGLCGIRPEMGGDPQPDCPILALQRRSEIPDEDAREKIAEVRRILFAHLPPDGPSAKETISALLYLLDQPHSFQG